MKSKAVLFIVSFFFGIQSLFSQAIEMKVGLKDTLGPMHMEQMALGQGAAIGLDGRPIIENNVSAIKALHPGIIRLFVLNWFKMFPKQGVYHFNTLDSTISAILQTGAKPLMCLGFKPRWLFPTWNQDSVDPASYKQWDKLVYTLVKHCLDRGAGIQYWEVGNEVEAPSGGGLPYHFTPESYVRYYKHTAAAILRADPNAKVGGPALADYTSPLLPALLKACSEEKLPLAFVSFHAYLADPASTHKQIEYVKTLIRKHPDLKPETILDEWNVWLPDPYIPLNAQPCFIAETIWQMKDAGLDWSCYYQIRDWYATSLFIDDIPSHMAAQQVRYFNRDHSYFGLFDLQNQMRPSYFAFKLLSRMTGERLRVSSTSDIVHGFATHDSKLGMYNLMLWNFSDKPIVVNLNLSDIPIAMSMRQTILDAVGPGILENQRLRPGTVVSLKEGNYAHSIELEPWAVQYWSIY